jgi:hypothetical protein
LEVLFLILDLDLNLLFEVLYNREDAFIPRIGNSIRAKVPLLHAFNDIDCQLAIVL